MPLNELIDLYVELILKRGICLESSDGDSADKIAKKIYEVANKIKKLNDDGRNALASLMHHQNAYVRNSAAMDVITSPRFRKEALCVLNDNKRLGGYPAMEAITKLVVWEHYRDRLT